MIVGLLRLYNVLWDEMLYNVLWAEITRIGSEHSAKKNPEIDSTNIQG
ncbi:hypothetical protein Enr17x_48460 [Gimesia fumaroli]|uniref:Uncharacterized protein n=1 Tax=Gimesia fumaroli TaxID=2527976 RepID=A0A518II62_9PLAN|nr:hypothetical protein Enr17x_48460 [Gimesia fumaroli]